MTFTFHLRSVRHVLLLLVSQAEDCKTKFCTAENCSLHCHVTQGPKKHETWHKRLADQVIPCISDPFLCPQDLSMLTTTYTTSPFMAGGPWKTISATLALISVVQLYYAIATFQPVAISLAHAGTGNVLNFSTYTPSRDSDNTALTNAQCDKAFPKLYHEIDRSVAYWNEKKHIISATNIDISNYTGPALQVLISDNELRVTAHSKSWLWPFWEERTINALAQLHRALLGAIIAGETLPTVEFSIVVGDIASLPAGDGINSFLTFTRKVSDVGQEALWLIPDFSFNASPPNSRSWRQAQRSATKHDVGITKKIQKLAWRGVRGTNAELRGNLLQATSGKSWGDVQVMDWEDKANFMDMDDLCQYMLLVHSEGVSYSSRLKHLLNCNSVTIIHDLEFAEFFYHLLLPSGPDQNYVAVRRDFFDLEWQVRRYLDDPKAAQRVADNAVAAFRDRYTSSAAEACYWRRLITKYSEVSFSPDPYIQKEVKVDGNSQTKKVLRGDSFHNIMLHLKKSKE